jgi:outer membrane protein assembly factor BamB
VYIATAENNVYAFDAHSPNPTPIWQYFAGPPAVAGRVYADADQNISPAIGIISTPVIDLIHSTLYFVAMGQPNPDKDDFNHTLHAIDIRTGKVRGTVVIAGSIAGGGSFNSQRENQRAALALVQDRIYIAWASFADHAPFDGLVMSYASMDTATPLKKLDQFQAAQADPLIGKRSKGGGIWHSGGGPAVDDRGDSIYVVTGNGDSSNTHAGSDFDSSTVKLDLSLNVADYYTPSYQNFLNENDLDLSVAGPMIPEDQFDAQGRRVKLLIHGSKAGLVYVLNRDGLGKFDEHSNNIIQTLRVFPDADDLAHQMTPSHIHTTPVYWRGPGGPRIYIASDYNLGIRAYGFDHEKLNATPQAANYFPRAPITQMSLSSAGSRHGTGVLWLVSSPTGTIASYPGILYAFDAETLDMLFSSETNPFDRLGDYPRFNAPTIADGLVFVPTFSNKLVVYGLCSSAQASPCRCHICALR